jgi:hypothetical protein
MDVRMSGQEFRFDGRDLPAAALDSCCLLPAGLSDLFEAAPVPF